MDIERYSAVIRMAVADCEGQGTGEIADNVIRALRIAQVLAGDRTTQPAPKIVSVQTPVKAAPAAPVKPVPFTGAVLIGAAPPVAGVPEIAEELSDVWESRPGRGDGALRLHNHLQTILPPVITLQVAGIDEPLTLQRSITSQPGMPFVHVQYTLAGQDMGPRVTLMCTTPSFDADTVVADITSQAGSLYRKDKVKLEPKPLAFAGVPSDAEIQRLAVNGDNVTGEDASRARQDAAIWARSRPQQWQ